MVIYIDETENDEYFIVSGFLVDCEETVINAYKRFKKSIKKYPISEKYKAKLYTEFKSTLLDRDYSRIKKRMLEEIIATNGTIIYAYRKKSTARKNQTYKESTYIELLYSILKTLEQNTTVIFDRFGKSDFEGNIISKMQSLDTVVDIYPKDSQLDYGLQFADNICSVIT